MGRLFVCVSLGLAAFLAATPCLGAASAVDCTFEYAGEPSHLAVPVQSDALDGAWLQLGRFKVRAVLVANPTRRSWLTVEAYAQVEGDDWRLISAQKVFAPYVTGQIEVATTGMGRSLYYQCQARP